MTVEITDLEESACTVVSNIVVTLAALPELSGEGDLEDLTSLDEIAPQHGRREPDPVKRAQIHAGVTVLLMMMTVDENGNPDPACERDYWQALNALRLVKARAAVSSFVTWARHLFEPVTRAPLPVAPTRGPPSPRVDVHPLSLYPKASRREHV